VAKRKKGIDFYTGLSAVSCIGIVFLLTACIPARVPDRLDDTPGPAVVVYDNLYEGTQFAVRYPDGWRIVTSEAIAPLSVILVSQDETVTIELRLGTLEEANFPESNLQIDIRGLTLDDDTQITAILRAPADEWDNYLQVFERVLETVTVA
jgi:hypothetical protein